MTMVICNIPNIYICLYLTCIESFKHFPYIQNMIISNYLIEKYYSRLIHYIEIA